MTVEAPDAAFDRWPYAGEYRHRPTVSADRGRGVGRRHLAAFTHVTNGNHVSEALQQLGVRFQFGPVCAGEFTEFGRRYAVAAGNQARDKL
jgi:hypothetical protein